MPLLDGSIQLSTSHHNPLSLSARCSSARASTIREMIIPCQSVRAFTLSGRQSGSLIPPSKRPRNGWGRGDFAGLLQTATMIIGQEVDTFSQKAVGDDQPLAKIRN